jgi:queuine tRNA-ribosyltransferase accessory subunit
MADDTSSGMTLLPDEMLRFVLDHSPNLLHAPRLGQLLSHGRPAIHTPHYVAATSRGVIPHLSHDVLQKHTDLKAVYMGLEDCESPLASRQQNADNGIAVDIDSG